MLEIKLREGEDRAEEKFGEGLKERKGEQKETRGGGDGGEQGDLNINKICDALNRVSKTNLNK